MSDEPVNPAGSESGGDASSERFFADHYLPVLRLCVRHLRDESDAEDAAQEVFRRALQHGDRLTGDPLPWLITVAKRVCLDELRRRRSGQVALERSAALAAGDPEPAGDVIGNPERLVVGHYFVRELLGRLTPAERRVIAHRVYEDASATETAQALGVAGSTTRVLLSRARQKLRQYLEEGQGAFAALPILAARALHGARRRLLLRPQLGEGGAAVLMPAALIVTVMMSPTTPGIDGAVAGRAPVWGAPSAGPSPLALANAPVGRDAAAPGSGGGTVRATGGRGAGHYTPPYVPPPDRIHLPPPSADEVPPLDIEPSPNYSQDHTVFMSGPLNGIPGYQLFRSTDGGATWSYVNGSAPLNDSVTSLQSAYLILPPATYPRGQFYAYGLGGLQMTTDNGRHFMTIMPVPGYVTAAPAWSNFSVVLSNYALWELAGGVTPMPISTFGTEQESVGPPLMLRGGSSGVVVLQAVGNMVDGFRSDQLLRCTPLCAPSTTLPFDGNVVNLVASPNQPVDHTLFAVDHGRYLAVSRDDGASFTFQRAVPIMQLAVVPGPNGRRLVAEVGRDALHLTMQFSDDDGLTWHTAAVDPAIGGAGVQDLAALRPGRLLASFRRSDTFDRYTFACSTDGEQWAACSPDHGT